MKVVFNGIMEVRSGGCVPCGAKLASKKIMRNSKLYILPSGMTKTFRIGKVEEVSDSDGEFLMGYRYTDDDGIEKTVFTEVE